MKLLHKRLTKSSPDSSIDYAGFVKFLIRVSVSSRNKLGHTEIEGPPRETDLELFLGWLGLNATAAEIKARLAETHEQRPSNRKTTTKRITKVPTEEDEFY